VPEREVEVGTNAGEALAWADTYADVHDYRQALAWLELAEGRMGCPLPAPYVAKRAIWTLAAGDGGEAA
jgi:hypothetical protein